LFSQKILTQRHIKAVYEDIELKTSGCRDIYNISEDTFTQEHSLIKVKRIATKKQEHVEIRSNNGYSRYKGSRKI
jgi:sarcosine oxidase delta subunit